MEDTKIIDLFWRRDESAISETKIKYGLFCRSICRRILNDERDEEECFSDVLLRLWNVIPPEKPLNFKAFIAKITRNLSIDRFRKLKRDSEYCRALEELGEEFSSDFDIDERLAERELTRAIGEYLKGCDGEKRRVFLKRYYEFKPTKLIAEEEKVNDQRVRHILCDMRKELGEHLRKEGLV